MYEKSRGALELDPVANLLPNSISSLELMKMKCVAWTRILSASGVISPHLLRMVLKELFLMILDLNVLTLPFNVSSTASTILSICCT